LHSIGGEKDMRKHPLAGWFLCLIILSFAGWSEIAWPAAPKSQEEQYRERVKQKMEEQKKNKGKKDWAIKEVCEFLRRVGKGTDAQWIARWYDNGKTQASKNDVVKIIFHAGENGYEPRTHTIAINENMTEISDSTGGVDKAAVVKMAASIMHEHLHYEEFFSAFGTTVRGEKNAYLGIHGMLADCLEELQSKLDSQKGTNICVQAATAKDILGTIKAISVSDVSLYEHSLEAKADLAEKKSALRGELLLANIRLPHVKEQKDKKEIEEKISELGKKIKDMDKSEKEGLFFDANTFSWTAEAQAKQRLEGNRSALQGDLIFISIRLRHSTNPKDIKELTDKKSELETRIKDIETELNEAGTIYGKKYNRKDLLEWANNLAPQMEEIIKKCDDQSKSVRKPETTVEAGRKDPSSLPSKERGVLFGDLCRCSCNPTVGGGSKYDAGRGCVCMGVIGGEWTVPMVSSGECFDRAAANAGVDSKNLSGEIIKKNYEWYENLLAEARKIIEEYLILTPRLFQKKSVLDGRWEEGDYVLLAANFLDGGPEGQALYAGAAAGGAPMSYVEMVKEKNRRGDPEKALGLVRAAEAMMPEKKASGETTNVLAEFAIMMSKASLNIVTELEFDEGLYLLGKAAEFYKAGESNALGQNIKRLIGNFEMWKKNWQVLQSAVPECISLIKDKRICACERLREEKITPASNGLDIREYASSQKWEIGTAAGGQPRPIPKKDKLMADLKQTLEPAKRQCASDPVLKTRDMAQLNEYETRKSPEKSPYINQEELRKGSAPVISDEQAIKKAEKMVGEPGLCDCEREKIKGILETAKEGFKSSKLEVDLTANKKSLRLGEYVRVSLMIKSGRKPYTYSVTGDLTSTVRGTEVGEVVEYPPKAPGTKTVKAVVTDAAGDSRTASITYEVLSKAGTSATEGQTTVSNSTVTQPAYDPTKDRNIDQGKKPIDTAKITDLSTSFQDKTTRRKPKDSVPVVEQPSTYTQTTPETSGNKEQTSQTSQASSQSSQTIQTSQTSQSGYPSSTNQSDDPGKKAKDLVSNLPVTSGSKNIAGTTRSKGSAGTTSGTTGTKGTGSTTGTSSTKGTSSTTGTSSTKGTTGYVTATYINQTKENAHIFTDGETFGSINRLAPGEKRNVQVKPLQDGRIKFYAGRNGNVIDSKYWPGTGGDPSRYPMVKFAIGMGGKEELVITTNLK
jgi:hypothetical protein